MPQLDPTGFAPQLIWLAITFVVLYLVMARVALPQVGQVLEERQSRISESLEKAEALRKDADEVERQYLESMATTRAEAQSLIRQVVEESAATATNQQNALADELAESISRSEADIAKARDAALGNLSAVSAQATQDIVQRLGGVEVSAEDAGSAVDNALGEVRR